MHEISFHLGAMLFPRKLVQRGQEINSRTRQFIEFLESRKAELGETTVEDIIQQTLTDRSFDNDVGTGNLSMRFASLRKSKSFAKYTDIAAALRLTLNSRDGGEKGSMLQAIEFFVRPDLTPLEAVIYGIHLQTGVDISDLGLQVYGVFNKITLQDKKIYTQVLLTPPQLVVLRKIIKDFVKIHAKADEATFERSTPENWLQTIGLGFDQRIKEIREAAEELP